MPGDAEECARAVARREGMARSRLEIERLLTDAGYHIAASGDVRSPIERIPSYWIRVDWHPDDDVLALLGGVCLVLGEESDDLGYRGTRNADGTCTLWIDQKPVWATPDEAARAWLDANCDVRVSNGALILTSAATDEMWIASVEADDLPVLADYAESIGHPGADVMRGSTSECA